MPALTSGSLSRRLLPLLAWLPALAAPLLIFFWLRDLLLNVPFMDDYVWLHLYEKMHDGTFNWWNDLFFVQMEHRLTVPAFLTWVFYHVKPGDITLDNWTSFVLLCATGGNILFLLKRTLPELRYRWFIGAVAMWILFSPVQAYTYLWADCFSSYMAPFFCTTALALFQSNLRDWLKISLCLLCAVLGSISLAPGVTIWILMLVPMVASNKLSGRRRWVVLGVWLVAFVITMKLYFMNMTNQAEPEFSYQQGHEETLGQGMIGKKIADFFGQPWQSARFVFMFTGAMFGRGTYGAMQDAAFYAGLALTILLVVLTVLYCWKWKDSEALSSALPWVALGLYTIGTGAMVALGRAYASPSMVGALWNRYTIHSMPMAIAVLVLACAWWQRAMLGETVAAWKARLRPLGPMIVGAFVMLVLNGWIYGQNFMEAWWSARLRDATCQIFDGVPAPFSARMPLTKNLQYAERMEKIGLLHPPMLTSNRLDQFPVLGTLTAGSGKLDDVDARLDGVFAVTGTAYIHGQSRPADGVLLAWKDPQGAWIMFSLGQVTSFPTYLRDSLAADMQYLYQPTPSLRHNFGTFDFGFDRSQIPAGDVEISAWAFDFKRQGVYAIPGHFRVNGAKGTADQIESDEPVKKSASR